MFFTSYNKKRFVPHEILESFHNHLLCLFLQLTRLHEAYNVRGEDASNMPTIPSQHRVNMQILKHWQPFQDLKLTFAVSRRAEQLRLRTPRSILDTVEDEVPDSCS